MIVVAIIAILAAVAYPSYQEQVRKSRRAQAKADLAQVAQLLERYRTANNKYDGMTLLDDYKRSPIGTSGTKQYDIAVSNAAATTFTVTATPVAGTSQARDRCGNLSIDQSGRKGNSAGNYADCW